MATTGKKTTPVKQKAADANYRKNAETVTIKHSRAHNVRDFTVGGYVTVNVPRIDRASTDPFRLPCVVVEYWQSQFFCEERSQPVGTDSNRHIM